MQGQVDPSNNSTSSKLIMAYLANVLIQHQEHSNTVLFSNGVLQFLGIQLSLGAFSRRIDRWLI